MKEPLTRRARNSAHISTACDACRKRKIKCDGVQPVCSQCARSSATEQCTWTRKDGRKKGTRDEERKQLALALEINAHLMAEVQRLREAQGMQPAQAGEPPLGLNTSGAVVKALDTNNSALGTSFDASSDPMQAGGPRPFAFPDESATSGPGSHTLTGTYDISGRFATNPSLGSNLGADYGDAFAPASIECPAPALPWPVMADPNLSTLNAITADAVQGDPHLDLPYPWDTGAETL